MEEPLSRKRKTHDDISKKTTEGKDEDMTTSVLTRPTLRPHVAVTSVNGARGYVELDDFEESIPKLRGGRITLLPSFSATYDDVLRTVLRNIAAPQGQRAILDGKLWVTKYAPRKFTDLISDERVNRQVLEWIKTWDEVVFGSTEFKTRMAAAAQAAQDRQGKFKRGRGGASAAAGAAPRKAVFAAPGARSVAPGVDRRPEKCVLLLHGPPGAGKTTLAHIIAVQAGYRAVEINASDDRSASSMYARVLPALEMESVDQGKPNCMILDEIDGAVGAEGQSAVDCVVAIANFKSQNKSATENDEAEDNEPAENGEGGSEAAAGPTAKKKTKKRKGKKGGMDGPSRPQSRPIICICNELYTPSLARLREIAQVVRVDKPDLQRLVQRLKWICEEEKFTAETKALAALAEFTERDIRASLNALQYLRRKSSHLCVDLLTDGLVGEKDQEIGIFKVWDELFRSPAKRSDVLSEAFNQKRLEELHRKEVLGEALSAEELDDSIAFKRRHYSRMYDVIQHHSDRDRIVSGIWANLFSARMHDPALTKTSQCIEWFEYADLMITHIRSEQSQALSKYIPASLVGVSLMIAGDSVPQLNYPREEGEVYGRQMRNRAVTAQLKGRSGGGMDLDMLTPLLAIIHPVIRTNNISVLQPAEKEALAHAAQVMSHYGLSYVSAGDESGLRLEPPIDKLSSITGHKGNYTPLTESQKEYIQREIDRIHMLAEAEQQSRIAIPRAEVPPEVPQIIRDQKRAEMRAKAVAASQELATRGEVVRDFFGRPVVPKQAPKAAEEAKAEAKPRVRPPVTYKFKEGYTNAVRRKVYMRDLL